MAACCEGTYTNHNKENNMTSITTNSNPAMIGKALTAEYKPAKTITLVPSSKIGTALKAEINPQAVKGARAENLLKYPAEPKGLINSDSMKGIISEAIKSIKEEIEELKAENKALKLEKLTNDFGPAIKDFVSAPQENPASPGNTAGTTTPLKGLAAPLSPLVARAPEGLELMSQSAFTKSISVS